jgi:tRNA-dihydrouridine synthase
LRRRVQENGLFYQLMVSADDPLERVLDRLGQAGADALDLNLACNSRTVRSCSARSALFENLHLLHQVLQRVRRLWPHVLTVKIRLGHDRPEWRHRFTERLKVLEETGVDALILHPRFIEERFKRRARHELFPWAASLTRLPLIANGDLGGPETLSARPDHFHGTGGVMLGRMAVVRPWIFATWDRPASVDFGAIWRRMFEFVAEDFPPALALRRLQMFTRYFACNFKFGHQFDVDLARASSLDELQHRAEAFFSRTPAVLDFPGLAGL